MVKKLLIIAAIVTALITTSITIYAEPNNFMLSKRIEGPVYELLNNIDKTMTFDSKQVIAGRAKEGTVFTMAQYCLKDNALKSIIVKKKDLDVYSEGSLKTWVLQDTDQWTVGASGIFVRNVELKDGKNKFVLVIKDKAGNKKTENIEVELVNKEQLTEMIHNVILKDIDKNIKD